MEYMAANDKLKGIIAKGKAESERYQAAAQQEIRKIAECATRRMASEPERRAPVKMCGGTGRKRSGRSRSK